MTSWNIGLEGRQWTGEELSTREDAIPAGIELIRGQILWSEDERLTLLAMLLEIVGARAAVRMGSPDIWRRALEEVNNASATIARRSGARDRESMQID